MDFSHVRTSSLVEEERMINSFVIMVGQSRFQVKHKADD